MSGAGPRTRLLGVFAHPDDEVFCCGGTFAAYVDGGAEAMVVSATRGEAGQIRDAEVATRQTLGAVRERELQRSCERLGIQHARCLDFIDGTLKDVDFEALVADVTRVIREFRPDVVVTFGPDGGYGHPDHIVSCHATLEAFRRAVDASYLAGDGASHTPARLYHAYFPPSPLQLHERLVGWLAGLDERFDGSPEFVYALLLLAEEATMLRYASDHYEVKWFPGGFYIIEQGEPASSLYLILSGEANVVREHGDGSLEHLARIGPGRFFGEEGIARRAPRNAHVIAATGVTCLVFSPAAPTAFAGRGEGAALAGGLAAQSTNERSTGEATAFIDVGRYVDRKVAALAEYRTQFPLNPDLMPRSIMQDLLGKEYFVQVFPPPEIETDLLPRS